jgi:hypothetical protein
VARYDVVDESQCDSRRLGNRLAMGTEALEWSRMAFATQLVDHLKRVACFDAFR